MKQILFLIIFTLSLIADPIYSFKNININYHDWLKSAQENANKKDFTYFGFEGGLGYNTVELYGFFNLENPLYQYDEKDDAKALRFSGFFDMDITIKDGWRVHFQDYALHSNSYYVNDFVAGIGYKFSSDFGLWFRPFIGLHHTYDSFFNDLNGYMTGWLINYETKLFSKKFVLFNWHEIEFNRKTAFYLNQDGSKTGDGAKWGLNGAVSGWFYPLDDIALGIQYRYAYHKLGSYAYQSGIIYSLKYYF